MWLIFLPFSIVFYLFNIDTFYAYGSTLLCLDFLLLYCLNRFLKGRETLLLFTYWFSPIVIIGTYVLGLNDLVPALFLAFSILLIKRLKFFAAGIIFSLSISAKLSMLIALPIIFIYLLNNKSLRVYLNEFLAGLLLSAIILFAPFILSNEAVSMVIGNPEFAKIYKLSYDLSDDLKIYIIPLVYVLSLYTVWRVRRLNFELFQAILGVILLLVVMMTPASLGWFIWSVPFLTLYQAMSGRVAIYLNLIFGITYLFVTSLSFDSLFIESKFLNLSLININFLYYLLYTIMLSIGFIIVLRILREAINQSDFFRLSRRPFVIGIAGDSGSGKDTVADSLIDLFGSHSSLKISGDDYHLFDRKNPIWKKMTHLNPMANDLEAYTNDILDLLNGKSIFSSVYNHASGKMSRPIKIKSNDFIIASGLHALYLPILRDSCSLKIFLDMDEDLRKHFKIHRDSLQRGHSIEEVLTSIEKRNKDSKKYIRPQSEHAELILSLQPINRKFLNEKNLEESIPMKLFVSSKAGINERLINRVLVGITGLNIETNEVDSILEVQMTIEGEPSSEDIDIAAKMLCQNTLDFLDVKPIWSNGVLGIMQLLIMCHINQALQKRIL
ncbi:MAG: uridine kinase [Euryarchaeota archaeon]|nr:uridine kinase [Euryarchaeota archaeon]